MQCRINQDRYYATRSGHSIAASAMASGGTGFGSLAPVGQADMTDTSTPASRSSNFFSHLRDMDNQCWLRVLKYSRCASRMVSAAEMISFAVYGDRGNVMWAMSDIPDFEFRAVGPTGLYRIGLPSSVAEKERAWPTATPS